MLGMFGLLVLVLGAFTAGGGLFNWEFLFSDGYREHGWVRSLGREGARGICMLLGGVLAAVGFVSQVVDAASRPIAVRAVANASRDPDAGDTLASRNTIPSSSTPTASSNTRTIAPAPATAPPAVGQITSPAAPARQTEHRAGGTASAPPAAPLASAQSVTIWNPDAALEEMRILLILQYRFEQGHQPAPGSQFFWVIDLLGVAHKIAFDGATLERQGQLTHLFDALGSEGFNKPWSTWIELDTGNTGQQISNRLEIDGKAVRSLPPSPAR